MKLKLGSIELETFKKSERPVWVRVNNRLNRNKSGYEKAICIFNYDYNAWLYYIRADLFYRNKGEAVFFPRKG